MARRFDANYFEAFYGGPEERQRDRLEAYYVAQGIVGIVEWLQGDIASVLEIGAGCGYWRDWFKEHRPAVPYRSTDVSAYACKTFGHERRDISRWRVKQRYDLVVCADVLEIIDDEPCERAIENVAAMTATFAYVNIATAADLKTAYADPRTDAKLKGRSAAWYRKRMRPHFVQLAFGLWIRRDAHHNLGELDRGP